MDSEDVTAADMPHGPLRAVRAHGRPGEEPVLVDGEVDYFEGLVESAPDAIVVVDGAGLIRLVNRQTERLFGFSRDELLGEPVEMLVPERHRGAHPPHRSSYFHEPRMRPMGAGLDLMARRKDGSEFPVDISLSPLATDQGTVVSAVIRDITERKHAAAELERANTRLTASVYELERRNREVTLVNELGDLLQSCLTQTEVNEVIARFLHRLFPERTGALFLRDAAGQTYELAAAWGDGPFGSSGFSPTECWALRRGKSHVAEDERSGPFCPHLEPLQMGSMCVPMSAQDTTIGLFHLNTGGEGQLNEADRRLGTMVADHLSLALANFQLRETLHRQSVRDGLTGLFNRRYMEESLAREIRRGARNDARLAVLLIDLDGFKRVNDTFGHSFGDRALVRVAEVLDLHVRGGDIACRYGGDEFVVVLSDCDLDTAVERGEQLRRAIHAAGAEGEALGPPVVKVSIGAAAFPEHGAAPDELIAAADAALYTAKRGGGNDVAVPAPGTFPSGTSTDPAKA